MLKHSLFYLFARGIAGLSAFLGLAVYTRLLSPLEYGLYALALVALNLADGLLFGWQRMVIARFIPGRESKEASEILYLIFRTWLVLLLFVLGVALFVFSALPDRLRNLTLAWLASLAALSGFNLVIEIHRAELQPGGYLLGVVTRAILSIAAGVVAILCGMGEAGPLWGIAAGTFVGSIYGFYTLHLRTHVGMRFPLKEELVPALRYGVPLSIAAFGSNFLNFGDRYVVGYLLGPERAGLYTANFDLAFGLVSLPMQAIGLAAYPYLVRSFQGKRPLDQFRTYAYRSFVLIGFAGSVAALTLTIGAPILRFLLGTAFRDPALLAIIRLAAATALINGLRIYHFDRAFHFAKKTSYLLFLTLIGAFLNIVINFPLVSTMGVIGAARATFLVSALLLVLSFFLSKRVFPLPFSMPVALAAGGVALMAFWGLN